MYDWAVSCAMDLKVFSVLDFFALKRMLKILLSRASLKLSPFTLSPFRHAISPFSSYKIWALELLKFSQKLEMFCFWIHSFIKSQLFLLRLSHSQFPLENIFFYLKRNVLKAKTRKNISTIQKPLLSETFFFSSCSIQPSNYLKRNGKNAFCVHEWGKD